MKHISDKGLAAYVERLEYENDVLRQIGRNNYELLYALFHAVGPYVAERLPIDERRLLGAWEQLRAFGGPMPDFLLPLPRNKRPKKPVLPCVTRSSKWVDHNGTRRRFGKEEFVEARFRSGTTRTALARSFRWRWDDPADTANDIMAWRLAPTPADEGTDQ